MGTRNKNGQGHFEQLENGKVRMWKQVGIKANGKRKMLSVTGTSETDCIKKMRIRENEYQSENITSDVMQKVTLGELCTMHLDEHLGEKDRLKPKAADRRESTIKNQIMPYPIGSYQVLSITASDIKKHIETLISEGRLSVSSIKKALDVINASFKWAQNNEYIEKNPCISVLDSLKKRLKKLESRENAEGVIIVLSEEQIAKYEKAIESLKDKPETYRYIFGLSTLLLLRTGIRCGEGCALRWSDWSRESHTLCISKTRNVCKNRKSKGKGDTYIPNENVAKTSNTRTILLSDEANDILETMYANSPKNSPDDYIFLNRKLKPTNPSNFDGCINKLYRLAGLPDDITGAHILRRTFATREYDAGKRVDDIAKYIGDTVGTVRKHYIAITKKMMVDGEVKNVVRL